MLLVLQVSCDRAASAGAELPSGEGRKSQPARVSQRLEAAEVAVAYSRPVARGRTIFGTTVPYGEIWNPGADKATRIELSHDLTVAGQPLPAGKYSIWAVPGATEWTLVFSRAWDVEHVPYPEGEDALRLRVRPQTGPHMESLGFYFPMADADSATLVLHWAETMIPLPLRVR
ncbi:MAG: DUF2911 domain-containing protein [Gemmatimonadetes bacterium]|nr:DUF2911 domain-containing protein [Gemmatimonadota bacterium]